MGCCESRPAGPETQSRASELEKKRFIEMLDESLSDHEDLRHKGRSVSPKPKHETNRRRLLKDSPLTLKDLDSSPHRPGNRRVTIKDHYSSRRSEKLKQTSSMVVKCQIYKLSEYSGVCEIIEKRVPKKEAIRA